MTFTAWVLAIGALLLLIALSGSFIKRMPLSTSVLYLGFGFLLGPHALALLRIDPIDHAAILERLAELAVLISLFATGLKLSASFEDDRWRLPLRLAFVSMLITVALTALVGVVLFRLPLGAAILLGGIIAPTDPVLASDVQVAHAADRDRLRFALTGEAGMNDGSAFPVVMLGLGLLGLHPLGAFGWRWLVVDVVWGIAGGLFIGALVGTLVGKIVVYLRTQHREAVGRDEFLTLGLIALAYGGATMLQAYGFLSVFAAGLALRRVERSYGRTPLDVKIAATDASELELATAPENAPAYMAKAVLGFNEQLERLGELSLVVIIAGTLTLNYLPLAALWFVPLLLCVIRPISIAIGAGGSGSRMQRLLIAWFGIRGIGSIYYLTYALNHGLSREFAPLVIGLTLTTIAASIVVHGISVTPLMNQYARMNRFVRRSFA